MLKLGTSIDCANPVNRTAPLNRGLSGWYTYVPGLADDNPTTLNLSQKGLLHDLTRLPGGAVNKSSPLNDGVHAVLQSGFSYAGNSHKGGLGKSLRFSSSGGNALFTQGTTRYQYSKTTPFSGFLWLNTSIGSVGLITCWSGWQDGGVASGWVFEVKATSLIPRLRLIDGGDTLGRVVEGSTNIGNGTWNHVGFTYDGSNAASGIKLWVNGQPEVTTTTRDTDPGTFTSTNPGIGGSISGTLFNGYMDDIRIYDRCLPAFEQNVLYNASLGGYQREFNRVSFPVIPAASAVSGGLSRLLLLGVGA